MTDTRDTRNGNLYDANGNPTATFRIKSLVTDSIPRLDGTINQVNRFQLGPLPDDSIASGGSGGSVIKPISIAQVDHTVGQRVQHIFDHIIGVCAEKNVYDMVDIVLDTETKKQYNIYFTADKVSITPHLVIMWIEKQTLQSAFNGTVKISMNNHIKPFRKQINVDKPETYDIIINSAIDALVAQNESYNNTKTMIENCVAQFNLDIEPEYIRRTKTLWHVSYKKGTLKNDIVIQYDETSKEFLFQKRYITSDEVVDLVHTTSRTT